MRETLEEIKTELETKKNYRNQLFASAPDLMRGRNTIVNMAEENVKLLTDRYSVAQQETAEARASVEALMEAIRNNEDITRFADEVGLQMLEQSVGIGGRNSIYAGRAEEDLIRLKTELDVALRKFGPNNPIIVDLQEQIRMKETSIRQAPLREIETARKLSQEYLQPALLESFMQRYKKALQAEQALLAEVQRGKAHASQQTMTLGQIIELSKEIDRLDTNYAIIDDQMRNIDTNRNASILTEISAPPRIPIKPVSPRLVVVGFLSMFFGTVAGLGIIWVLDIMDDRFRTPEELKMHLNTQILTMVPAMEQLEGPGFDAVMCNARPNSTEAESFRSLRTNLDFAPGETGRIVCTSTEPGDGKTTVSSNMAVAFAQSGRRTLIIDADMRRPGLSTLLDLRDDRGLSVILRSTDDLDTSIVANLRESMVSGLDVISSGPRPVNPAELLS